MLVRFGNYWRINPVGVLIRAAFPRVVRLRAIEPRWRHGFEFLVSVKLGTVVRSNSVHPVNLVRESRRARVH